MDGLSAALSRCVKHGWRGSAADPGSALFEAAASLYERWQPADRAAGAPRP